jgi:hypothetical protein
MIKLTSDVQVIATSDRVPINIAPEVRARLRNLLWEREMRGVGYSAFINRACEVAEAEIAERRRGDST